MAWGMAGAEVSPDCTTRTSVQRAGPDVRTGLGDLAAHRWASSPQPNSVCPTVPARDPVSSSNKMQRGTRVAAPSCQAEAEGQAGSPASPWTPHLHGCWERALLHTNRKQSISRVGLRGAPAAQWTGL